MDRVERAAWIIAAIQIVPVNTAISTAAMAVAVIAATIDMVVVGRDWIGLKHGNAPTQTGPPVVEKLQSFRHATGKPETCFSYSLIWIQMHKK